jgi:methionyl-tRNA formyltransferase
VRIVFIGTGVFACPALEALASTHDVSLVVTQPDRPAGRGRRLREPPVKEAAGRLGLCVLQPERIRREDAASAIRDVSPDVSVVAAYGQILRESVFSIPPLGTVNIHASILPAYRGAAPVHWAIIRGEESTGVTTFLIDAGMDTGDILLRRQLPIGPEETMGELEGRLAQLGAELALETLAGLKSKTIEATPQPEEGVSLAPMLSRDDGRIDWSLSAPSIHNLVRGTSPWPGAWTLLGEERVKVLRTALTGIAVGETSSGAVTLQETGRLLVGTGQDLIELLEVQREGRPRTDGRAFVNGLRGTSRFA